MKKIILLFTAVTFVMSSVTARAQLQNSEAESVFNTLEVAYSPTTMNVNFGIDLKFKLNSIAAEWSQARALPLGFPLYVHYGVGLQYTMGKMEIFASDSKLNILSAKVPVNLMYVFEIPNTNLSLMPYAGLNSRCNILAQSKDKEGLDDSGQEKIVTTDLLSKDDMGNEPFNRFVFGWQVGAKVSYDRFLLGIGYEGPVSNFYKAEEGLTVSMRYVNISLGIKF